MNRERIARGTLFVCLLISAVSCTPPGQRLLRFTIEANGKTLYEGMRGVPDSTPVSEMWDVLDQVSFEVVEAEPDLASNLHQIEGEIVVRIKHVENELRSASLKKLTLTSDGSGASWTLDEVEINRVKLAADE